MTTTQARPLRIAITTLAVGAVLTACGSSGSGKAATHPLAGASTTHPTTGAGPASTTAAAKASSSTVDVCGLLTSAQASSINQVTYGAATPKHLTNGYDECEYANSGTHSDPVDIQALDIDVLSIPGCWTSLQSADGPGKAVPGVGDAAFGYQIGVDIKVGDRCVEIRGLTHNELNNDYTHDIALAHIILSGLH